MSQVEHGLRDDLHNRADAYVVPVDVDAVRARVAGRRRRRRTALAGSGVAVAAGVTALALALTSTGSAARPAPVHPVSPHVSVASMLAGRWSELPRSPLTPRMDAAVAWTGSALLVWGGASGQQGQTLDDDGAVYDVKTARWHAMASSPLGARDGVSSAWTGREWIVWGGYTALSPFMAANDGAAYDPATNSWRQLPTAPLSARVYARAIWTGDRVVVFGGQPPVIHSEADYDGDGAAYDPATNTWATIPAPVAPQGHRVQWGTTTAFNGSVLAWSQWFTSEPTPTGARTEGGADLFRLDADSTRWTAVPADGSTLKNPVAAVQAGSDVIVRGYPFYCPVCQGPGPTVAETLIYNPATNTWRGLAPDVRLGILGSQALTWFGNGLLSLNGAGRYGSTGPGATSIWNAATDKWAAGPSAPFACPVDAAPPMIDDKIAYYCPHYGGTTTYPSDALLFTAG
ncbi:Kelch repeat-containing protein [Humibacter sp.]|uniref:Kelch repeat-containing protein n=1 Tax=Humibacter sp. TaxID=1940291 RepID=UPI002D14EC68|nr:hypothetical protein [Humibacter sp.]HVX07607.1 hypothetical protein [Humibacter sp.]